MKTTWRSILTLCIMLTSAVYANAQFKLGDKSTIGQTWSANEETGKCVLTTSFNPDKDPSSYTMNGDTAVISLAKCQTYKGLQIEVRDTAGNKVYNSQFKCKSYRSYDNPVYVESVASLVDILNQYESNEALGHSNGQSDTIPAHCIFKVGEGGTNGDGAFGAYPGQWKNVKYDFYYRPKGYTITEDITFDISTVYEGSANLNGAKAVYYLYLKVGSFRETVEIYTTGDPKKTVQLAAAFGKDPSMFSNQDIYIQVYTEGTGTEVATDKIDPIIGFDNMVLKCEAAVWVNPAAGLQGNTTLNNESSPELVKAGETTTIAFPLKTTNRSGAFVIVNDLLDNTKEPMFSIAETGALKANDGSGNYTVDVAYTFEAPVFDGEFWTKPKITVAAPAEGTANDDMMLYFDVAPADLGTYVDRFELDCGTRIWYDFSFQAVNKIVGYFANKDKAMVETATQLDNDPIIQMLKADPAFGVDVVLAGASDDLGDLSGYDMVVVQESWSSSADIYKPTGSLGFANIPVPFIHNKVWAMKDGRGFQNGAAGSGGEVEGTLYLRVGADNQTNPLFSGIAFDADSVQLFITGADDNGGDTRTKGLNYAVDVVVSEANTLLGSGNNDPANTTVCVNDIPAGATFGSETLQARMITIPMNSGAMNKDLGNNLTEAGLTLWRNAIYSASGLEVPSEPVSNEIEIELTASAGMVATNTDSASFQITLPAGSSSVNLDVNVINGKDAVIPTISGLSDGQNAEYELEVTAPVGTDSKVFKIYVHVQAADEILYLSADPSGVYDDARAFDTKVYDQLVNNGFSVTFAKKGSIFEWTPDGVIPFDYTPYKGMVISAGEGSSNVNDYAKRNYPIPCVTMQSDGPRSNKWGWVGTSGSDGVEMYQTTSYDIESAKIKITNNNHYITQNYNVDDLVQWTLGTADSADWSGSQVKSYNLTDSIPDAVALATIPADGYSLTTMWAIPEGASVRSMNGDYDTYERVTTSSRIVLMSLFNDGLLYASDDFGALLTRSLKWAMNYEVSTLESLTASTGTLTPEFDPAKTEYQLNLPSGTTAVSLSAEGAGPATVVVPDELALTDGMNATLSVEVTSADGSNTTTYNVNVHVQSTDEILYLSANSDGVYASAKAYDTKVYDMLVDAGYSVTFAKKGSISEWTPDGVIPFDYTPFKGMVISAGEGSSNVNDCAKRNYPIPCVTMQPDGPRSNKWGWVGTSGSDGVQMNVTKAYDVETAKMKITNNDHFITQNYNVDDLVQWTLGTADSADWSGKEVKSYNLTDSIPEAIPLATIPADGTSLTTMWAIPAGASVRSMNGEYNVYERVTTSNRVVLISLFNDGLLYLSEDFAPLLTKSLEWVIDDSTPVEEFDFAGVSEVVVYPNPVIDQATFSFPGEQNIVVSVTLYNVLGQQVNVYDASSMSVGSDQITINTSDLEAGVYVYLLKVDGKAYSGKMSVVK